jgi:two-component system, NtrC family, response regulator HydG
MPSEAPRARVLVVDDAPVTLELLSRSLEGKGYLTFVAPDVAAAVGVLEREPVDLLVTDLKMPGASGLELTRHVRAHHPDTEVILITGYPTVESAVQAVKMGAEEYLPKPFTQRELLDAVERALEKLRLRRTSRWPQTPSRWAALGITGESAPMAKLLDAAAEAARADGPVLILGERGTGRALLARAIHRLSSRAAAPFFAQEGEGILDGLSVDGAPSIEEASPDAPAASLLPALGAGTFFLGEVGHCPRSAQATLLAAVTEREGKPAPLSGVRLVASSSEDLGGLVSHGVLLQDLYLRLRGVVLRTPPLRERAGDIALLCQRFAARFAVECHRPPCTFSDAALDLLRAHAWPGNLPELLGLVRALVIRASRDTLDVIDLPSELRPRLAPPRDPSRARTLREVEAEHLHEVLASVGGNKSRAAELLGINRKTLATKLRSSSPAPSRARGAKRPG